MRATSFEISPEVLFWAVAAGVVPTEPKSDISRCDDSALFFSVAFSSAQEQGERQTKGKRGVSETQTMKKRKKRRKRRKGLPSERSSLWQRPTRWRKQRSEKSSHFPEGQL